jgi:hypothetical protein
MDASMASLNISNMASINGRSGIINYDLGLLYYKSVLV